MVTTLAKILNYNFASCEFNMTLRWRHNGHDSVSNHQPHGCLLNRLFRRRSRKTSKLLVTGLCAGNSPGTGDFPAQMASNAENVSIWWRHHECGNLTMILFVFFNKWISILVSISDRSVHYCPACRTTLITTRFWVVLICPIIKCLNVLEFSFILLDLCLFITIFQFYFKLCTYCNILDIYL